MNWRDEYFTLLKRGNAAGAVARQLLLNHLPAKLYRFRRSDLNSITALTAGDTWLSAPVAFNDPFDCALTISPRLLADKWHREGLDEMLQATGHYDKFTDAERSLIKTASDPITEMVNIASTKDGKFVPPEVIEGLHQIFAERMAPQLKKHEEVARDSVRICCFCENLTSILMWSHYAGDHTGFCMEYDTADWVRYPLVNALHPVNYSVERFDATEHMGPNSPTNILIPIIAACNKSKDWEYESEWRLVVPGGVSNAKPKITIPGLARIIVGTKASTGTKDLLRRVTSVPVVEASLSPTTFAIDVP